MDTHAKRVGLIASIAVVVAAMLPVSCRVVREKSSTPEEPSGALKLRIENATASTVDVAVGPEGSTSLASSSGDGDSTGGDASTAGKMIVRASLLSEATIRVDPGEFSEGEILCGAQMVVTAAAGGDGGTSVLFEGAGTGTPGFDENSVGLSGERILDFGEHYTCSDTVVIRINDDGTGVSGSSSSVGLGEVAVYAEGAVPPVGDLPSYDAEPDDEEDEPGDTTETEDAAETDTGSVNIALDNQTESGIALTFLVGTGDAETDDQLAVTVLPFGIASGTLTCARQITVQALIIEPETGVSDSEPTLYQVTLTGDGTGTVGFDEATIGPENTRLLVRDEHFDCGDTIRITILDDAGYIDEGEDEMARIGSGTVEVVPAGA